MRSQTRRNSNNDDEYLYLRWVVRLSGTLRVKKGFGILLRSVFLTPPQQRGHGLRFTDAETVPEVTGHREAFQGLLVFGAGSVDR